MKKTIKLSLLATTIALLTGCSSGPKPNSDGKPLTIFVKSHTAEKFKNITEETAFWNGISPFFVKDKQYMRCDMSEEAMSVFVNDGFELATNQSDADYTFDVTVLSCGNHTALRANMSELPLEKRGLYMDFMRWVNETDSSKLPKTAKEIANLIKENNPEGFKRFEDEEYLYKYGQEFDYEENWGNTYKRDLRYIRSTKGVVLPAKYHNIPDEDKKTLLAYNERLKLNSIADNTGEFNSFTSNLGLSIASSPHIYGANSTNSGLALAGAGVIMSFFSVSPPTPINHFKITNNTTGKSWEKEMRFNIAPQNWHKNIEKPMDDWVIDEIPWRDLD